MKILMYVLFVDRYGRRISMVNYIDNYNDFISTYHHQWFKITNPYPCNKHLLNMIGRASLFPGFNWNSNPEKCLIGLQIEADRYTEEQLQSIPPKFYGGWQYLMFKLEELSIVPEEISNKFIIKFEDIKFLQQDSAFHTSLDAIVNHKSNFKGSEEEDS